MGVCSIISLSYLTPSFSGVISTHFIIKFETPIMHPSIDCCSRNQMAVFNERRYNYCVTLTNLRLDNNNNF
jgi:hypothetical protein